MARRSGLLGGYIGGIPVGLVVGAGLVWWFLIRKPPVAAAVNPTPWLKDGRVTDSIPGVTVKAEGGEPIPVKGETSESLADRYEAWGMKTGQTYPTMF